MRAIPALVLLSGAVICGVLLGLGYLRRTYSKPIVIGLHVLFGAGSLEVVAMLLHGAADGTAPAGALLKVAAGLLAFALWSGLMAPLIVGNSRAAMNAALVVHVTAAASAVVLCVWWSIRGLP